MQAAMTDIPQEDISHIHYAALATDVRVTPQQERFLALHIHGFGIHTAARHAGMDLQAARDLVDSPEIARLLDYMRDLHEDAVRVTRETVTVMLLEAHRKAASASEEIAAAKELGKLHGLYKSDEQKGTKITHNTQINGDVNMGARKLARMTTEQLIEMAQLPGPENHPPP